MRFDQHLRRRNRALAALCAAIAMLGIGAAGAGTIISEDAVTAEAFDAGVGDHSAKRVSQVYGIRMGYGAPFDAVSVSMPTWSTSDSDASLALYRWDTDYDTTISAGPLALERFEDLSDNAWNTLSFDEQPAGEYLLCIQDVTGSVGVWQYTKSVSGGYVYDDGLEGEADWQMTVDFTQTPAEPFYTIERAMGEIDGEHTPPAEAVLPADSLLYTHPVMPDTWVFTDGLGRTSLTYDDVGGVRDDRTAALFYWTWHADLGTADPVNLTEFMKAHPEAKNDYTASCWPSGVAYFWNEPIYGFYKTNDAWVLRRQGELLANAGIDVVFTDNTNGNFTWRNSYKALYETWDDAQKNGAVDVPKISYMLPFGPTDGSREQLNSIYLDVYRPGKYQNLWFYWDEKPMLMAHSSNLSKKNNTEKEILAFFTWRPGQPGYLVGRTEPRTWGWLSTYPQALYYNKRADSKAGGPVEQMTVGVAVNHNYKTHEITAMNGENVIGRSYTSAGYHTEEGASLWGYNFSEQMEYALEVDPRVLFITGWNEWTAGRHENWSGIENAFPDQYIDEYSRDIEPTKGELKDHYYYLLVNAMRRYKGCRPIPTPSVKQAIDIRGDAAQWDTVEPYYAAYIGNTGDRDAQGYGSLVYTETSGRNDIIGAQVARDDAYLYFHVACAEDITPYTDRLWMTLYIDCDLENQGWETFDYVVNKAPASASYAVLERFTGEGYETEKAADVTYQVNGRYLDIKIAKADLGLSGEDYTVNFAWTDNVHDEGDYSKFSGDIMDFYISGDAAPGARFKYSFISTAENAGAASVIPVAESLELGDAAPYPPVEKGSAADTAGASAYTETAAPESAAEAVTAEKKDGGKTIALFGGAVVIGAGAGAYLALGRKKKKRK